MSSEKKGFNRLDKLIMQFVCDNFFDLNEEEFLKKLEEFLKKFPEKIENPEKSAKEIVKNHYKHDGIRMSKEILLRITFPEKY